MHEMLRQFALAQHAADTAATITIKSRYCHYYLTLLQDQTPQLLSTNQHLALTALQVDFDHVCAAWLYALEQQDFVLLAQSVEALFYFCTIRGSIFEGITLVAQVAAALQEVVAGQRDPQSQEEFSRVREYLGAIYAHLPDIQSARPLLR
jgi:hypothetical protein